MAVMEKFPLQKCKKVTTNEKIKQNKTLKFCYVHTSGVTYY